MRDRNSRLTICEVLRQINDKVQGDGLEDVRDLLATAEFMAKRIVAKLREYNEQFDAEWWVNNPEYKETCIRELKTYKIGKVK